MIAYSFGSVIFGLFTEFQQKIKADGLLVLTDSRYWTLRKFFQKKQPLLSEGGREAICSSDLSFLRLLHSEALLAGDLIGISIKNVFYFAFSYTEKAA